MSGLALQKDDMALSEMQVKIEQVREQLRSFLDAGTKSQKEVAAAIGMSSSAVSQFLSGQYRGDVVSLAERIEGYLTLEEQRVEAPQRPEFVPTSIATDVQTVLRYAHVNRDIGLVYGDAGIGKTVAIEHYAGEHPDVILLTGGPDVRSSKALADELMEILGKREYGNLNRMVRCIINTLNGSGRLLIIDEAQHLSRTALEVLRKIHDSAKIGLVLCGNREIYDRMHGRGEATFAQFFSRVGIRRYLQCPVSEADTVALLRATGQNLSPECFQYLHTVACGKGGFRYMLKLYIMAVNIARQLRQPLTIEIFERSRLMLVGAE